MDNSSLLKILVAVDDSESSHQALLQALKLINLQGATFVLLSVEEPVMIPLPPPGILSPDVLNADISSNWEGEISAIKRQEQKTRSAIEWAEHLCQQAGVQYVAQTEFGEPKHVICEVAQREEPNLMVIGSHGYSLVERVLIGSVSEYVVHHAQCPVLVVRQLPTPNETQ